MKQEIKNQKRKEKERKENKKRKENENVRTPYLPTLV
jgi:hypothetical protein